MNSFGPALYPIQYPTEFPIIAEGINNRSGCSDSEKNLVWGKKGMNFLIHNVPPLYLLKKPNRLGRAGRGVFRPHRNRRGQQEDREQAGEQTSERRGSVHVI